MSDGKIKKFLSGNIFIEIKGLRIEDLFEICKSSGIKIINARRVSYTGIEAEISCYYFRKLEKIMRKEAYEINIKKKCGLPFKIFNKKTLFFILPALCAIFFAIFSFSLFIWDIEYSGFDREDVFAIMEKAEAMGLKKGALKSAIDKEAIVAEIRSYNDNITWASISFYGSKAFVSCKVSDFSVDDIIKEKDTEICDVVALKDGYIESISVYAGTKIADIGQNVKKGDVLVSADIYYGDEEVPSYSVHADADVYASCVYAASASGELKTTVSEKTGNSYKQRYIEMFGQLYLTGGEKKKYKNYTADVVSRQVIGENMPLAFSVYDIEFCETEDKVILKNEDILRLQLYEKAYFDALKEVPEDAEIVDIKYSSKINDDILLTSVIIETTENISLCCYR